MWVSGKDASFNLANLQGNMGKSGKRYSLYIFCLIFFSDVCGVELIQMYF